MSVCFTGSDRNEILVMIGCGIRMRYHKQVYNLFNLYHPEIPRSRSAVSIEDKYQNYDNIADKITLTNVRDWHTKTHTRCNYIVVSICKIYYVSGDNN